MLSSSALVGNRKDAARRQSSANKRLIVHDLLLCLSGVYWPRGDLHLPVSYDEEWGAPLPKDGLARVVPERPGIGTRFAL